MRLSNQADAFLGGSCKQSYQEYKAQSFQEHGVLVQYYDLIIVSCYTSARPNKQTNRNCQYFINTFFCSWQWISPFQEMQIRKPPRGTNGYCFSVTQSKLQTWGIFKPLHFKTTFFWPKLLCFLSSLLWFLWDSYCATHNLLWIFFHFLGKKYLKE